jgi:hypothetical protein
VRWKLPAAYWASRRDVGRGPGGAVADRQRAAGVGAGGQQLASVRCPTFAKGTLKMNFDVNQCLTSLSERLTTDED